jgi:MFS family permease
MWFFVSLHMQQVLGFDALAAGLAFLPQSVSIVIGSQLSSRLLPRVGPRAVLVAGSLLTAAGFVWFATLTPQTSWLAGVLGPGIAVSLGMGLVFPAVTTAATNGVPDERAGLVSGLVTTSRQVGGAIGLAVLSTLATARTSTLTAAGVPAPEALTAGTTRAFAVAAVVVAVGAVLALLVPAPSPAEPREREAAQA